MAVDTSDGHPAMDYREHTRTYKGFIRATIYSLIFLVLLLVFLAAFVA